MVNESCKVNVYFLFSMIISSAIRIRLSVLSSVHGASQVIERELISNDIMSGNIL